jgi:hypothetical protein
MKVLCSKKCSQFLLPSSVTLLEYGLLKHMPCEKYLLDEEEDGMHYLSGIDGSLFNPKYEKFYSNDRYCVDFFFAPDPDSLAEQEIKVTIVSLKSFLLLPSSCQPLFNRWRHLCASMMLSKTSRMLSSTYMLHF